jgi:cytosine/uracil/thiamine/allantoin permease
MRKHFDQRAATAFLTALVLLIARPETTAAGANLPSPTEVKFVQPHRGEIMASARQLDFF